jgi:UDP-3-O-[3-hydroxymyristoyl] glucosamine N-acyltransferase LpxD
MPTEHRLSVFATSAGFDVIRDGLFEAAGKIPTPLTGLLVPVAALKYVEALATNPGIVAVITTPEIAPHIPQQMAVGVCAAPQEAHALVHQLLAREANTVLARLPTSVGRNCEIHETAWISPTGVTLGDHVHILPNAVVLPGSIIGDHSVIRSGTVIGTEAFEVVKIRGRQQVMPQIGGVKIHDHVEVQANTCVVRAVFAGHTEIGSESVIDNMVHVAHDVKIGRRVRVGALAMLGGRLVVEDDAYIAPAAIISNGLRIGQGAQVTIGAVVTKDVPPGMKVSGNFAVEHSRFIEHMRTMR